jgi:hypothetical protein
MGSTSATLTSYLLRNIESRSVNFSLIKALRSKWCGNYAALVRSTVSLWMSGCNGPRDSATDQRYCQLGDGVLTLWVVTHQCLRIADSLGIS